MQETHQRVMADRVVLTPSVLHAELLAPALMLTRKGGHLPDDRGAEVRSEHGAAATRRHTSRAARPLKGLIYGGMNPRASMPMLLSMYRSGNLKLDELVTRRYRLDQINDAITRYARRPKHPRHHRIRLAALCSPAGSGYRPTGRRRVPSPARSRTPTGR